MKTESFFMKLFKKIGLEATSWSLRRLFVPVNNKALVLEVGSGGNPYARANVLIDAYETTRERHWAPLITDRPTVIGFVEKLPFKDKSFDFIIASHVLEHSIDPVNFLNELMRVGKSGYIETPDAFMERLNPYMDHRLEVTQRDGALCIRKKKKWINDEILVEYYEHRAKNLFTKKIIRKNPYTFHLRFYWENKIEYNVFDAQYNMQVESNSLENTKPFIVKLNIKQKILFFLRQLYSQKKRNRTLDIYSLLQCPECRSDLEKSSQVLCCKGCGKEFQIKSKVPIMT
jgi:hypothetical protein